VGGGARHGHLRGGERPRASSPEGDLEELSAVVRDLDGRTSAAEIPEILLDALCPVFGFGRGVVLASPEGDLSLMAYRGPATRRTCRRGAT
jgi:hypothetical protein